MGRLRCAKSTVTSGKDYPSLTSNTCSPTLPEHMFASSTYRHITSVLALFAAIALLMLAVAPASSGASRPGRHLVKQGETLWSIASTHYHTNDPRKAVFQIEQANQLNDTNIVPGQVILLP